MHYLQYCIFLTLRFQVNVVEFSLYVKPVEWKLEFWAAKTLFAVSVNGIIPTLSILVDIMVYWLTYSWNNENNLLIATIGFFFFLKICSF